MARSIKEIQDTMITALRTKFPVLSSSTVAEWRLWTYVVAASIHTFELLLDIFRREVDELTNKITPGTTRWYAQMCYRFQNGHKLLFDERTAMLYYAEDAPDTRIVSVVAITEAKGQLLLKVAKTNKERELVPLSSDELYNFSGYIDSIKFAGIDTEVVSTTADLIRYDIEVYYSPTFPATIVGESIRKVLIDFKTSLSFDAMFYPQQLVDAVMHVDGVMTVALKSVSRKGTPDEEFIPIGVMAELYSGYFNYDDKHCNLILTSTSKRS